MIEQSDTTNPQSAIQNPKYLLKLIERWLLRIDITLINDCRGRKKRGEPVISFDNLLPLSI
jgi:hypothetical protein